MIINRWTNGNKIEIISHERNIYEIPSAGGYIWRGWGRVGWRMLMVEFKEQINGNKRRYKKLTGGSSSEWEGRCHWHRIYFVLRPTNTLGLDKKKLYKSLNRNRDRSIMVFEGFLQRKRIGLVKGFLRWQVSQIAYMRVLTWQHEKGEKFLLLL